MKITAGAGKRADNSSSMKSRLQHVLSFLLVLSTSVWAQTVCPMMLVTQKTPTCAGHPASVASQPAHHRSEHDCCPRSKPVVAAPDSSAKLSDCNAGPSCC